MSLLVFLLSLFGGGLVAVMASPVVEARCNTTDALGCNVGWYLILGFAGFLAALAIGVRSAKLGWAYWCASFALLTAAILLESVSQPVAIGLALLTPVLAVLASDLWGRTALPRWQRVALVGAVVAAVGALAWWFFG